MFRAFINRVRTICVFLVFQNFLLRIKPIVYVISFIYLILHPVQTIRMLVNLQTSIAAGGAYVFGPKDGSGGTKIVADNLFKKITNDSAVNASLFRGHLKCLHRKEESSNSTFLHIVDSKILLMILLFTDVQSYRVGIYVWNCSDFNFHAAKILRSNHRIQIFDFETRNSFQGVDLLLWCESRDLGFFSASICDYPDVNHPPRRTVNFIGRLTYQKGIDLFLNFARNNPNLEFRIFGSGPFAGVVKSYSKRYGNIRFEGYVPNVFSHLTKQDIVVVPSRYFEGASLVVLEALSNRIPVVSSGTDTLSLIKNENHFYPDKDEDFFNFAESKIKNFF